MLHNISAFANQTKQDIIDSIRTTVIDRPLRLAYYGSDDNYLGQEFTSKDGVNGSIIEIYAPKKASTTWLIVVVDPKDLQ